MAQKGERKVRGVGRTEELSGSRDTESVYLKLSSCAVWLGTTIQPLCASFKKDKIGASDSG